MAVAGPELATMKLPAVSVEVTDPEGTVQGFRLSQPSLTADPWKRSQVQQAISLLYAYADLISELMRIAAPTAARTIAQEERMAMEDVG